MPKTRRALKKFKSKRDPTNWLVVHANKNPDFFKKPGLR
jgi:hypothetical protein